MKMIPFQRQKRFRNRTGVQLQYYSAKQNFALKPNCTILVVLMDTQIKNPTVSMQAITVTNTSKQRVVVVPKNASLQDLVRYKHCFANYCRLVF